MRKRFIIPALFVLAVLHGAHRAPLRILPLGDSITDGFYTGASVYNSYRKELKNRSMPAAIPPTLSEALPTATLATTTNLQGTSPA